jgi:hypothetical protein
LRTLELDLEGQLEAAAVVESVGDLARRFSPALQLGLAVEFSSVRLSSAGGCGGASSDLGFSGVSTCWPGQARGRKRMLIPSQN